MIDRDLIEGKFDIIERNLNFIKDNYSDIEPEDLENSYKDYQALKFSLFEMIEACIDIANHIISSERFRRAESYADMFKVLGENKILSENLAGKMALMARFRNFLVHRYEKLDTEKIVEIVREHLVDIEMFMEEIRRKYLTA
ncbi:MAG: DUF86 domain-containing protein [Thermoplasmata archaeon]|nr:MAG: DUF86 domain-containing protein [Thermoplasmata archaeon]